MADPLSITASIVGITVPTLHAIRVLAEDLQQLKDAPDTVRELQDDLRTVDMAIKSLQKVEDRDWEVLGANIAENSRTTIYTCQKACDSFRTYLQRWTRHSTEGNLTWQDRTNVGFFKRGQIKSISEQLQNCKITINTVVNVAVL